MQSYNSQAEWAQAMIIQWCLKGIPEIASTHDDAGFGDLEALNVLTSGLQSQWLRNLSPTSMLPGLPDGYRQLSDTALNRHVNSYGTVSKTTPYISLSAGIVVPATHFGGVSVKPAWHTAVDFATRGGRTSGYVFRCWCIVAPKAVAGLPNVADHVRDLNIFRRFWIFHDEGEITAKILLPSRQIQSVDKIGADLKPEKFKLPNHKNARISNTEFVHPAGISNLMEMLS